MKREGSVAAMESALSAAAGRGARYALVNRPACFASLPQGLRYEVEVRPAQGAAHHEYARHGVLLSSRPLTPQEMRDFELGYMLDGDQGARIASVVVDQSLSVRAKDYLDAYDDDASLVRQAVMQEAEALFAGLRVSFQDHDRFVSDVLDALRGLAAIGRVD